MADMVGRRTRRAWRAAYRTDSGGLRDSCAIRRIAQPPLEITAYSRRFARETASIALQYL